MKALLLFFSFVFLFSCAQKKSVETVSGYHSSGIPSSVIGTACCVPFQFETTDGSMLSGHVTFPKGEVKAVVYCVHGIGENQTSFQHMVRYLESRGYALVTYDARGHGNSPGQRGHIVSVQQQCEDLESLLNSTYDQFDSVPRFAYGHSFGSGVLLNYALNYSHNLDGIVLSAPLFHSLVEISPWKKTMGNMLWNYWPTLQITSEIPKHHVTRDSVFNVQNYEDPAKHRYVSPAFLDMFEAGEWALDHAADLAVPTLIMQGTEDRITDISSSREFVWRAKGNVEMKEWDGYYHQLHNEIGKEAVFGYVDQWMSVNLTK